MTGPSSGYPRSYLFTVRLWSEDMGHGGTEIRGEVRHVLGGGVRYFQDWTTLVSYLAERMQELESQTHFSPGGSS
jgi:hypothetical protein